MNPFTRYLLATLVGLIAGSGVNMLIVIVGGRVVPAPSGVDLSDAASIARSVDLLGPQHYAFPFLAHAGGTFVGAYLAARLARRAAYAYVIGGLFLVGGIAAATMIPAPAWFLAADLLLAYLPMAFLGGKLAQRSSRPADARN